MNFSNISTNFGITSENNYSEIISTLVTFSNNNTKIKLISSDTNGVIYGNAFVLGKLLIQFSVNDASNVGMSDNTTKQFVYFPYKYSKQPYTMFLNGMNLSNNVDTYLRSYNESYFSYTTNTVSYLNFMVVGPLPDTPFPSSISDNTYSAEGADSVVWNTTAGSPTLTVTYDLSNNRIPYNLLIYRPCQTLTYRVIGGGGGGGSGANGVDGKGNGAGGGLAIAGRR